MLNAAFQFSSRFLAFLAFVPLLLAPVQASDIQVLTIKVVDVPVNGNNLTINSIARTWTNVVTLPASQMLIGTNIPSTTTNLFRSFGTSPMSGFTPQRASTNIVRLLSLPGQIISAAFADGAWAELSVTTITDDPGYAVRVPMSSQEPTATQRTNISSLLVTDLSRYPSNAFPQTAPVMVGFVNTGQAQLVDGAKTFTGSNVHSNTANYYSGGSLTNLSAQYLTTGWKSSTDVGLLGWYFLDSTDTQTSAIAPSSTGRPSIYDMTSGDYPSIAAAYDPDPENALNAAMGDARYGSLGSNNNWTGDNTFSSIKNSTATGTFTLNSDMAWRRLNISTLTTGANSDVPIGTDYVYVKLTTGPTGAFSTDGFVGGRDGRFLIVENGTSGPYAWTIPHESGLEATPANRIRTRTAAPITINGQGTAIFIYDGQSSRWLLITATDGSSLWDINAGVLSPTAGTSVWTTNHVAWRKFSLLGSLMTPSFGLYSVGVGTTTINLTNTVLVNISSSTPTGAVVNLSYGDGLGQHVYLFNTYTNTGFSLYSGTVSDNTNVTVTIRGGVWSPTQVGESIHLIMEPGGWVEQGRSNPYAPAPTPPFTVPSGMTAISLINTNVTAGDTDLYTVPAGMRLYFREVKAQALDTHSINFYTQFSTNGVYYRLSSGSSSAVSNITTSLAVTANAGFVLEAGEKLSVNTSTGVCKVFLSAYLYSTNIPLFSPRILRVSTTNQSIYTCPASRVATSPVTPSPIPAPLAIIWCNGSSVTKTISCYSVPNGAAADETTIIFRSVPCVSGLGSNTPVNNVMTPGDTFWIKCDGDDAGAIAFTTLYESSQ